jgi:hypothetical protein
VTVTVPLDLHMPDEPIVRAEHWLRAVHEGEDFDTVLTGADGVSTWLWSRWRSLAAAGIDQDAFSAIVVDYRRELWLWLAGERTWAQCCSGLIGRLARRTSEDAASG